MSVSAPSIPTPGDIIARLPFTVIPEVPGDGGYEALRKMRKALKNN